VAKALRVVRLVVGPMAVNCYVLYDRVGGEAVVVDPGGDVPRILQTVRRLNVELRGIYLTHAHIDHAAAAADLSAAAGVVVKAHPAAQELLQVLPVQAQLFGLDRPRVPENVNALTDGQEIAVGSGGLVVRFTPGHSPDGVCFLDEAGRQAWVGDLIFRGSVGRTDLPGGSTETLMASIRRVVLGLGDDWRLYPGHGPETTVGEERRSNPFLTDLASPL